MDSLDRVDLVSAKRKITPVGTLAPMAHSNLIFLKSNENSSDQFKSTIIRKQIKNRTSFKIYVKTSENYKLVEIAIEVCATNYFVVVFEQSRDLFICGEIIKAYLLVRKLCRVHIKTRRNSRVARMRHDTISSSFDRNSTKFENKVISFLFLS